MTKELKSSIFNKLVESVPKIDISKHIEHVVHLKKDLELSYIYCQKKFELAMYMQNPVFSEKAKKHGVILKQDTSPPKF